MFSEILRLALYTRTFLTFNPFSTGESNWTHAIRGRVYGTYQQYNTII